MSGAVQVNGMVLLAAPHAEYDRRLVLLTRERGKITAFAHGARRQNSPLLAPCTPFAFGVFTVYEGRSAYTLTKAEITNYFPEIRADALMTCCACYFLELADYYTRENLDGTAFLNLLYATFKAFERGKMDRELIRCVFEMKAMALDGTYPVHVLEDPSLSESARYALAYVLQAPLQKLYTFNLKEEIFCQLRRLQDSLNRQCLDRRFKSLEILERMKEISINPGTHEKNSVNPENQEKNSVSPGSHEKK